MNVEALIAYLGEWLKELIKTIVEAFDWLENLPEKLEGTTVAE